MAAAAERPEPTVTVPGQLPDEDPAETQEWLESLDGLVEHAGRRAGRKRCCSAFCSGRASDRSDVPGPLATDYVNTIPPAAEPEFPGDEYIERRIRAYSRWNAAIMVHRAQRPGIGVGGHISTYASAAVLYEVGFNHFFRGHAADGGGDQIYFQGHASPGIYARAFLEGRLSERPDSTASARNSRTAASARGLPSYPHPRLMPDFWEFPTVSMGLGAHQRHLPGPVQPLPAPPRHQGHQPAAGLGVPRRWRDGRARIPRRHRRRRPRGAGQPDLRGQLQPATPRRPGPRQRQDHPGAGGVLPRRGLERHQGDLGPGMGSAACRRHRRRAGQADERHPRRGLPDLQGRVRRLRPRALLRPRPPHRHDGRAPHRRRRSGTSGAAATTTASCTRPTRRRPSTPASRR